MSDIDLLRKIITEQEYSVAVVKQGEILATKKGEGLQPLMETLHELNDAMQGASVGDRILGKASALLCAYAHVKAVYSPQASKAALAVLIRAGIPGQTDKLLPFIDTEHNDSPCLYERLLQDVHSPKEAYHLLSGCLGYR